MHRKHRKQHSRARVAEEDRTDLEIANARLRAIDADPSRLIPWEDVKRRLGIGARAHRG